MPAKSAVQKAAEKAAAQAAAAEAGTPTVADLAVAAGGPENVADATPPASAATSGDGAPERTVPAPNDPEAGVSGGEADTPADGDLIVDDADGGETAPAEDAVEAARAAALAVLLGDDTGVAEQPTVGGGNGGPVAVWSVSRTGIVHDGGGDVECLVLFHDFAYRRAVDGAEVCAHQGDTVLLDEAAAARGVSLHALHQL